MLRWQASHRHDTRMRHLLRRRGSSVGARAAGIRMVAGIDMCATATATYAANFPDAHVVTNRLEDIPIDEFKEQVGSIDILLASPECRNHTCAKGSAPRDESSRATAMHAIEYARVLAPRWLVLENVIYMRRGRGMQNLNTGSRHLDITWTNELLTLPILASRRSGDGCFWSGTAKARPI